MISEVLSWKFKDQAGMKTKDGKIVDFPGGIPTQADQDLWTVEYNSFVESQAYISKRRAEYPPMEDYLDGVVKGDNAQITKYIDDCQAVKLKHPK